MAATGNTGSTVDLAGVEREARQLLLAGDFDEARDVLQEARDECQQTQDFASVGAILRSLGDLEWSLGRFDVALRNYEQAQAQFRRIGSESDEADVLLSISDARARGGVFVGALEACRSALKLYEEVGKPLELAHCHFKLGALLRRTNASDAEEHFIRAEELYDEVQRNDEQSKFRVENPPLPETVEDCRTIESWIMLEVVRRELAILRGEVKEPKKKRVRKPAAPAATAAPVAAPAVKPLQRDLMVGGIVLLAVTAVFGLLLVSAKFATPLWMPLGKVPFFILAVIAAGLSVLLLRSSEIESTTLAGAVPVIVGCIVFFGGSMMFEGQSQVDVETAFLDENVDPLAVDEEAPDAKRLEMEQLLARFERSGDRRGQADTLVELARMELLEEQSDRALVFYSRSYELYQGLGASADAAAVAVSIGDIYHLRKRPSEAYTQYILASNLYGRERDPAKRVDALLKAGDMERMLGRAEAARKTYLQAFALAGKKEVGTRVEILLRLAQADVDLHRLEEANTTYRKALSLAAESGDLTLQSKAWLAFGELESFAGRAEAARSAFDQAAKLALQAGDTVRQVAIWQRLGNLERAAGRPEGASQAFHLALKAAEKSGDRTEQAATILLLAEIDAEQGKLDAARKRFNSAMATYADLGMDTGRGHAALGLGDLELKQSRANDARDTYRLALHFYETGGSTSGRIAALERLSKVLASTDPTLAKSYAAKASDLRKSL